MTAKIVAMESKQVVVEDLQDEVELLKGLLQKSEKVRADQIVLINSLVEENAILTSANMTLFQQKDTL